MFKRLSKSCFCEINRKMNSDPVRRVIRLYYAFQLFFGLLLWLPIFYEYQRRLGLTNEQIFRIQSIYYIAFLLLEIPTGLFADRFGYRQSIRLGAATLVISNLLPVLLPSYDGFLWHFILIALARSLISGAASAYMYEFMTKHGQGERYKRVEGEARAYSLIGKAGARTCFPENEGFLYYLRYRDFFPVCPRVIG